MGSTAVIGKLFGSKKVPTNGGNQDDAFLGGPKVIKVFELELSNMEGPPAYSLTHQLTIGSEIGNIVIADPSVSPRHATFILQHEMVSVIDHGSMCGTLVNGKKIPAGRYIILEESDTISVGDLEVRIRSKNQTVDVNETLEVEEAILPSPAPTADEPLSEMQEEDKTPVPSKISRLRSFFKSKPRPASGDQTEAPQKGKPKSNLVISSANTYSANALVRVVAFVLDLILAYTLLVIFWPFDEFRHFLDFIPAELAHLLGVEWSALWESFTQDFEFVRELASDVFGFISGYIHMAPLLMVFLLLRFVSTLFLGVSISEFLLSVGPTGNRIWARIGGMIRVLIGAVIGPFLVFDVPSIVSRRTLKEFITFTNIQVRSKLIAVLASIVLLPLFVAFSLLAPLIQGLEPPESINVNDKLERRVIVEKKEEVSAEQVAPTVLSSKFMHLELSYRPEDLLLIPNVKFQGLKSKLSYRSQMIFYHRELQRPVNIELFKTFDLQQLIAIGIKGNFFLHDKLPELHSYVYQAEGTTLFKASSNEKAQTKFANEFMSYVKTSLGLSLVNAFEVMEMETPFLKGYMDFRSSLLELLEYKEFDEIGFIKIGNTIFMKVSYNAQKPFDLIIPLLKGEGRIFKIDYDKKENLSALTSRFYNSTLDHTNWINPGPAQKSETLDAFQVLDLLAGMDTNKKIRPENALALYGFYFEKSAEIFKRNDEAEYDIWKKSLASIVKVIENLQEANNVTEGAETVEDPVMKLKQNFKDLIKAVESKDLTYFGLTETQTI